MNLANGTLLTRLLILGQRIKEFTTKITAYNCITLQFNEFWETRTTDYENKARKTHNKFKSQADNLLVNDT